MNLPTATFIEDQNIYLLKLPYGTFQVNGQTIEGGQRFEVASIDDVRQVSSRSYVEHYTNTSGKILNTEEFNKQLEKLTSKGNLDEDDGWEFESLDDEFAYRKFRKEWTAVLKTKYIVGDPMPVAITPTRLETGNPHIISGFTLGDDPALYTYNRHTACFEIVRNTFKELGMERGGNHLSYHQTAHKKIWANNHHDTLRFVMAFGAYAIGRKWDNLRTIRGTLDYVTAQYEKDKKELREHITRQYNEHFTEKDDMLRAIKAVWDDLHEIHRDVAGLDVKVKSSNDHYSVVRKLDQLIKRGQEIMGANKG